MLVLHLVLRCSSDIQISLIPYSRMVDCATDRMNVGTHGAIFCKFSLFRCISVDGFGRLGRHTHSDARSTLSLCRSLCVGHFVVPFQSRPHAHRRVSRRRRVLSHTLCSESTGRRLLPKGHAAHRVLDRDSGVRAQNWQGM